MQKEHNILAVVCSDLHLSHRVPLARSNEADWYSVMRDHLEYLRQACRTHNAPLIIAGDVFDRWNPPPQLINFAMQEFFAFPFNVYAIPGQHDLPDHNLQRLGDSAYGSLMYSDAIKSIHNRTQIFKDERAKPTPLWATPFQWGEDLETCLTFPGSHTLEIAIIHKYVWMKGCGYPGAPVEASAKQTAKQLEGFDAAVFGDNHKGFAATHKYQSNDIDRTLQILNCGTVMRRKSDEMWYKTQIGLINDRGEVITKSIKTASKETWLDIPDLPSVSENVELQLLLRELANVGDGAINFQETVHAALEGHRPSVRKLVLSILDQKS